MVARLVRIQGWSNKSNPVGGTTYDESVSFFQRETFVNASAVVTPAGTETFLKTMTFTNTEASAKSNAFITVGFPVNNSALGSSGDINAYYEAAGGGQGNRIQNFQIDNYASDLAGNRRMCAFSAIISGFTASGTRRVHFYRTNTPTPSGTAITAADLLATSFNVRWEGKIGTATVSANARFALTGTSVMSKTSALLRGTWRSGPACTEFIVESPAYSGATAHASGDGIHVGFHIKAWKADASPVSAANPILGTEVRVICENGHANRSNTEYTVSACSIARTTNLSNSTFISTTVNDPDGVPINYNFNGNYTHWFGARYSRMCWIGEKPTYVYAHGSVATAVSVSTNTNTSALGWSRMLPFYFATPSDVDHSGGISELNSTSKALPLQTGSGAFGEYTLTQGQGGETGAIGLFAAPEAEGMVKWNADGRRRIFEGLECLQSYRFVGATRCYVSGVAFWQYRDTNMPDPLPGESTNDPWEYDISHEPNNAFCPYILSGDLYWLELLAGRCSQLLDTANNYNGVGVNYTIYGPLNETSISNSSYGFSDNQERGAGWGVRSQGELPVAIPDRLSVNNNMMWKKSAAVSLIAHTWQRCANVCHNNTGSLAALAYGTGVCQRWTHTPSQEGSMPGTELKAPWMGNYTNTVLGHLMNCGAGNTNLDVYVSWRGDEILRVFTCTDNVAPAWWLFEYRHALMSADSGVRIKSLASGYKELARRPHYQVASRWTKTSGPGANLSGLSGTAVEVKIPVSINTANSAWYIGAWFQEVNRNYPYDLRGSGIITSIRSQVSIVVNTCVSGGGTFTTTSIPSFIDETGNTAWTMPAPHPSDAHPTRAIGFAPGFANYNYTEVYRSAVAEWADAGVSGAVSAHTFVLGQKPGISDVKWSISRRN